MAIAVKTVNDFPYWSQVDYKDTMGGAIKNAGCAPTAIAMVLKGYGKDVDPEKLCNECKGHGWSPKGGATKEVLFPYVAKKYELAIETIHSFDKCCEYARQGYPIILDGKKIGNWKTWDERCLSTCYGPLGHYVVLVAMSGSDVVINDPRGVKYSGIRPRSHASDGFVCGFRLGTKTFHLDSSKFKKLGSTDGAEDGSNIDTSQTDNSNNSSVDSNFVSSGTGNSITVIYNDTTTVQESLPNANVSDNWIDMHKIKGITLHMHPPYHNCTADSMAKYFESLGWDRNFHYKVDKDTKIDFDKKPVSGQTTGGNLVGTSVSDFEITPKDPLNQTVVITGENVTISNANGSGPITMPGDGDNTNGSTDTGGSEPGNTIKGNGIPEKIYNYCVAQGCSTAAACGIVGNAERESTSNFDPGIINEIGAAGLFQWYQGRRDQLEKEAKAAGKSWKDPDFQIQFMWKEWSGPFYTKKLKDDKGMTLDQFKKMSDPKEAARVFEAVFEVSGDTTDLRAKYAQKWYDKFSKMGGTATSYMAFDDTPSIFRAFSNETESDAISAYTDNYTVYYADEKDDTIEQIKEPFGWPAPTQTYVQSYFGYRSDSLGYKYHPGIDIANYAGTGAYCYADGVVKKVLTDTKVNGYVRIDHGYGIQTVYGSLNKIYVKEGDTVEGGLCIGTTGTTVSNPLMHLHFEMLKDGKHVDPLNYIQPGGGYVINPFPQPEILSVYGLMRASSYGISSYASISNTSDKDSITWDKIDKGKICFASADNNTHTYIDANLFNNQHPKYTLSIGVFFYDEFDMVEKTGNVNYPETEKKLIEQCAKALYDEGFTSKQLWREFDLNRAPSPFLYLDKDKWTDFCDEVDKQVKWLNKKYGKVTSTYIPNNLLTNQNTNNFIETAPLPDGVIVPGGNTNPGNNNTEDSGSEGSNPGGSGNFIWPVPGHSRISSPFGPRKAPTVGASTYHRGIDIPAPTGTKVVASDGGKVVVAKTGYNGGRGTYIVIDHGNGMGTLYQHLNKYLVKVGQAVKQGDKVAEVGSTGIGTGPHLHFEVQTSFSGTKGTPVNPEKYVSASGGSKASVMSLDNSSSYGLRATSTFALYDNEDDSIYPTQRAGLFIGDNWEYNMRNLIEGEDNELSYYFYESEESYSICEAAISKDASYYYNPSKNIDRLEGMEKDVSFVYIHLGYNRLKDNLESNDTIRFLNKIKELYSNVPVYVAKLPHCGRRYEGQDYKGADAFNEAVDKYNDKVKSYCIKNNFYFIDISKNLVDDEGYLKDSIVDLDGITLKEYYTYYNNIKNIIEATSNISMVSAYNDRGDADIELPTEEPAAQISTFALGRASSKQYCYVGNTAGTTMYKNAKTSSSKVATLAVGDELEITGSKNTFYKCTFNKKKGYVSKDDVVDIGNNHGEVFQEYVGQICWIKYENTDYYKNTKLAKQHKDLKEQTKAVIIGADTELGIYKIKTNDTSGYVKGYAVTFDNTDFKTSDTSGDIGDKVPETETDTGDTNSTGNLDLVALKNADFEEEDISMWSKMGSVQFERITNPEWGTPEHWPYRKKAFARIKNADKKVAGISQEFEIKKDDKCYLRVLFYIKQVTQKDVNDGPVDPDILKQNKIAIKLLDGTKVKYEKEIDISGISNTIWTRIGCIFTDLEDSKYSLFIGGSKQYDLFIDDITVEKIYKNNIDNTIGDSSSSSGITLSGLGTTSIDNGGVMVYKVGKPSDSGASQPKIKTIITQEEYEEIMQYATAANIDLYTNSFEPYDKDLVDAKTVGLTNDIRESLLPEQIRTFTDNIIRYKVVETGPGSVDHCVKPVDELSVLLKNTECKVDPIYPDLVIPPKYVTSEYDTISKNSIPMTTIENATASMEDTLDKSFSYDYKLLDKKTKKSIGSPVNYYDPYCYDDKITDLENHYPKVLIDEIESRLYSCNHPGCPIAHPMAKNFAMLNDMAINQSKVTEQRLVRLENTLATMVRYLGRMASRVNINCVYYGGQTVLGKYKCIRCLRDDRVHDGATVTMDQCLTCTRYEPIIGQVYDILDETGFNGSAILDDMQMSYMSLDDFKNLNDVEKRSTVYNYVNTNKKEKNKPKSLIDEWQERDKKAKLGKDAKEEELNKLKPSDYLFMMDWTEDSVDLQQPDVKVYPTEKIAAKYYNQAGDPGEEDTASAEKSVQIGVSDKVYDTIASGEWIDTREKDDSIQTNRYTSLDFYFERFNMNRTGYEYDNGIKGNIGLTSTSGSYNGSNGNNGDISNSINGTGSDLRKKITDMAKLICQECKDGKAWYCGDPRTIDHDKPQKMSDGRTGYDCTSFVSCCYKAAGLSDFYDGRTGQGVVANNTLAQEVLKKGGEIWFADKEGMAKALPGDVLMTYKYDKINKDHLKDGIDCRATHAIIYMGDGMIAHASSEKAGIKYEKADYYITGKKAGHSYFLRPKSLVDADKAAANNGGIGPNETAGTIDGMNYVCKLGKARCTEYGTWDGSAAEVSSGKPWSQCLNKTVASHNLPFGTKIYIPGLKGKVNSTGLFTVEDTGGYTFDFDVCTSTSFNITGFYEAYIISYGTDKRIAESFTYGRKATGGRFEKAFREYMKYGGCLIKFNKFDSEDANASWWKK